MTGDSAGNLYVGGEAVQRTQIGLTKQKTPIYAYTSQWIVRKSSDGGLSWTTDAAIAIPQIANQEFEMCSDLSGAIYAASTGYDASGIAHSIIRSNASGTWQTVDDFQFSVGADAHGYGLASAPDGTLHAAGYAFDAAGTCHGFVRANSAAAVTSFSPFSIQPIDIDLVDRDEVLL